MDIHAYTLARAHTHTHTHAHTPMHTHTHTHTHMHTHTNMHTHKHAHICTHTHKHAHKHAHTHMQTYMCILVCIYTSTHSLTHSSVQNASTSSSVQNASTRGECVLQAGADFASRSGLTGFPHVIINGVPMDKKYLSPESFEEGVVMEILKQTPAIQKAVYNVGDFGTLSSAAPSVCGILCAVKLGAFTQPLLI